MTAGRGHKGQKARAGGFHKVGFEGGQMPLQRRLPKRGFVSLKKSESAEVRLGDLKRLEGETVDLAALKAAGLVPAIALRAKVILAGSIDRKVALQGVGATKGARAAIEAATKHRKVFGQDYCRGRILTSGYRIWRRAVGAKYFSH